LVLLKHNQLQLVSEVQGLPGSQESSQTLVCVYLKCCQVGAAATYREKS